MSGDVKTSDMIELVKTLNDSLSTQNKAISAQSTMIGRLEGKLDNALIDIQDLKKYREIDKREAIENRNKDRQLFIHALNNQVTVCPNTFALKSYIQKLNHHIKKHRTVKSNKKSWLKWLIPVIISACALILSLRSSNKPDEQNKTIQGGDSYDIRDEILE